MIFCPLVLLNHGDTNALEKLWEVFSSKPNAQHIVVNSRRQKFKVTCYNVESPEIEGYIC